MYALSGIQRMFRNMQENARELAWMGKQIFFFFVMGVGVGWLGKRWSFLDSIFLDDI